MTYFLQKLIIKPLLLLHVDAVMISFSRNHPPRGPCCMPGHCFYGLLSLTNFPIWHNLLAIIGLDYKLR